MKYEAPEDRTDREIVEILRRDDVSPEERIRAVLSAVFCAESDSFAGDLLIDEFCSARYNEKSYLKNIFETFYQSRTTAYRIDDSISALMDYKETSPVFAAEVQDTIEALQEFKDMFG